MSDDRRYPIGRFNPPDDVRPSDREDYVAAIAALPEEVRAATEGLSDAQLDTPYREGGWTVRQVVHHLADNDLHGYVRCRRAVTEETPRVSSFDPDVWAALDDARQGALAPSLAMIEGVHTRWAHLLRSLDPADWRRPYEHPSLGETRLEAALARYAWHGRHHVAQITALRERKGWTGP
jgi:uncharacterized damage-inducible protein DinB